MKTTRTKSIVTIVILLLLLAALTTTSALTTTQPGFGGARPTGAFSGTPAPGGNNQGNGTAPGGGGNFQGRNGAVGGLNLFGATRALGIDPQVMGYVNIGASVIAILLALLCAYGVWKQKRWALNLSMVLAVLFLLAVLPGVIFAGGRFNLLNTALNISKVGASAVIVFMGMLPSVRDSVS